MRWFEVLEQPMVSFIVMGTFSTVGAVIFWEISGSLARAAFEGKLPMEGATFEAGGALAGFIIVFTLSYRIYARIRELGPGTARRLREYILRVPRNGYNPQDPGLACKYKLYDRTRGGWDEQWQEAAIVRGGEGSLKIYVAEMQEDRTVRFLLEDSQGHTWHSAEDLSFGVTPVYMQSVDGPG